MTGPRLNLSFAKTAMDLDQVHLLAGELHETSQFSYVQFSNEKFERVAAPAFGNPAQHALVIAELDSEPIGFIFYSLSEYFIGTDELLTSVTAYYVS